MKIDNIEVRRHNGRNSFGPWRIVTDSNVPEWVEDMILDNVNDDGLDSGFINRAGSVWQYRVLFSKTRVRS